MDNLIFCFILLIFSIQPSPTHTKTCPTLPPSKSFIYVTGGAWATLYINGVRKGRARRHELQDKLPFVADELKLGDVVAVDVAWWNSFLGVVQTRNLIVKTGHNQTSTETWRASPAFFTIEKDKYHWTQNDFDACDWERPVQTASPRNHDSTNYPFTCTDAKYVAASLADTNLFSFSSSSSLVSTQLIARDSSFLSHSFYRYRVGGEACSSSRINRKLARIFIHYGKT